MSDWWVCVHLKEMWKQKITYSAYNMSKDAAEESWSVFQEKDIELEIKKKWSLGPNILNLYTSKLVSPPGTTLGKSHWSYT